MRKLITEKDVRKAIEEKSPIYIDDETIVTALAEDLAKANNIECIRLGEEGSCLAGSCGQDDNQASDPLLSANEVYQMLKACIDAKLFTEEELLS